MLIHKTSLAVTALLFLLVQHAHGDTFDFEVGLSYDNRDGSVRIDSIPAAPFPILIRSSNETDDIGISGRWFFGGVNSTSGPRSRAALTSRASFISFGYTDSDADIATTFGSTDPAIPTTVSRSSATADLFSAELRYVWAESGWYGIAALGTSSIETRSNLGRFSSDSDIYTLGAGVYAGDNTTLDLRVSRVELGGGGGIGDTSSTLTALTLAHIGDVVTWQYGIDASISSSDVSGADELVDLRFSMYPTRSIAFGFGVDTTLQDPFDDGASYEFFGSWFATESVELAARYGFVDLNESGNVASNDQDSFGLGVRVRF